MNKYSLYYSEKFVIHFNTLNIREIAKELGTPLWIYDKDLIVNQVQNLRNFDVIRYAQKACSNINILKLIRESGAVVDAVSLGELKRSIKAGFIPGHHDDGVDEIVYTADLIDRETLSFVIEQNITVNAGSIDMLERIGMYSPGHHVWLRINPGFGHGHSKKTNTGGEQSKHGIWHTNINDALNILKKYKLNLVGLHMHIGSGVDYEHLSKVCDAMVQVVRNTDYDINGISAGGGLSIPYKNGDPEVNIDNYYELWDSARKKIESILGHKVKLEIEPGRYLVAQSGLLISEVHAIKETPDHKFVLIDAGFNDLLRPSFYGSYHDISLIKNSYKKDHCYKESSITIAGPLCESGDVFTLKENGVVGSRLMIEPQVGDFLVFHDVGAYGASMSSNYNSRPLAAEVLLENGTHRLIRRRQSIDELLKLET